MTITNIYQAKTHLSALVDQALDGEEVVIARAGKPLVKLVPYLKMPVKRVPGEWKGKVKISDDFDDESEEINEMFYGNSDE